MHRFSKQHSFIMLDDSNAVRLDVAPVFYEVIHRHRGSSKDKHGGGVAFIYRQSIKTSVVDVGKHTEFESLAVKLTGRASTVVAVCIYRVPGAVTAAFIDDLCDLLDQLLLMNVRFVICGDFNASSDRLIHVDVADVLVRYNLKQYINVPTHDHGNTLDLLITLDSEIDMLSNVSVQTVCFSDHSLISCRVIISIIDDSHNK